MSLPTQAMEETRRVLQKCTRTHQTPCATAMDVLVLQTQVHGIPVVWHMELDKDEDDGGSMLLARLLSELKEHEAYHLLPVVIIWYNRDQGLNGQEPNAATDEVPLAKLWNKLGYVIVPGEPYSLALRIKG